MESLNAIFIYQCLPQGEQLPKFNKIVTMYGALDAFIV